MRVIPIIDKTNIENRKELSRLFLELNDGVNGFPMPFDTGGMGYAQKIIEVISVPERYHRLIQTTRDEYERCLDWHFWGKIRSRCHRVRPPAFRSGQCRAATVPSGVAG
jgi:hypothetical protein